jgi:hypothetical protein
MRSTSLITFLSSILAKLKTQIHYFSLLNILSYLLLLVLVVLLLTLHRALEATIACLLAHNSRHLLLLKRCHILLFGREPIWFVVVAHWEAG